MPHEVVAAFAQAGLPLCPRLRLMLDEHPDHCTERRGCGLTQATRRLAEHVNRARDPLDPADLALFEDLVQRHVAAIAAQIEVPDTDTETGEAIMRPATPADRFRAPFANTTAAAFANGGRRVRPHLIELVQDRNGRTIWSA